MISLRQGRVNGRGKNGGISATKGWCRDMSGECVRDERMRHFSNFFRLFKCGTTTRTRVGDVTGDGDISCRIFGGHVS